MLFFDYDCGWYYLNNTYRVFLSKNYRLIVAPQTIHVLKTNIFPLSESLWGANMLVLRTNFYFRAPLLNHIELLKGKCRNYIQLFIFYKSACPVQKNFRGLSILVFFSDGYYCTTLFYISLSRVSCKKVEIIHHQHIWFWARNRKDGVPLKLEYWKRYFE